MFIVAQALVGFACNAFYTVGFAFIEEQSEMAMAGIYFGLVRMGSSAGPIAGYIGLGWNFIFKKVQNLRKRRLSLVLKSVKAYVIFGQFTGVLNEKICIKILTAQFFLRFS